MFTYMTCALFIGALYYYIYSFWSFRPTFWHAPHALLPGEDLPAEKDLFSPGPVMRPLMAVLQTYHFKGLLVPIGVDRRQQMDSGLFHQVTYPLVARQILQTHELHQQEEQLSSQHLITMGTCWVTKLWFTWRKGSGGGGGGRKRGVMYGHCNCT